MENSNQHIINNNVPKWAKYLGLAGVIGGLVLLAGDLVLYIGPMPEHQDFKAMSIVPVPVENMALIAEWRLIATALFALLSTWLYIIGSGLLYFILKPANKLFAILGTVLLVLVASGVGIDHALYFAAGVSAKNAYLLIS